MAFHLPIEPWRNKVIRRLSPGKVSDRAKAFAESSLQLNRLDDKQVVFELTSIGMSGISASQWSASQLSDESYAGSSNFSELVQAVSTVFGKTLVCPFHNRVGALGVLCKALLPGYSTCSNTTSIQPFFDSHRSRTIMTCSLPDEAIFSGNLDIPYIERLCSSGESKIKLLYIACFAQGKAPVSLENVKIAAETTKRFDAKLLLDVSNVVANALVLQQNDQSCKNLSVREIVANLCSYADLILLDGMCVGGVGGCFIATNTQELYDRLANKVIVFEGLHTYGGMSGRTLAMLAVAVSEMCDEWRAKWHQQQVGLLYSSLKEASVPCEPACDGVHLQAYEFFEGSVTASETVCAALFVLFGIRALPIKSLDPSSSLVEHGGGDSALVPITIPRYSMTNEQIRFVGKAITTLYSLRKQIPSLVANSDGKFEWPGSKRMLALASKVPELKANGQLPMFVVSVFEPIGDLNKEERRVALDKAGWNPFLLESSEVVVDLLTDSGNAAMSNEQWLAWMQCTFSPTPATCQSSAMVDLTNEVFRTYGHRFVIPAHQGRGAEQVLTKALIEKGKIVCANMSFTTTRWHQDLAGCEYVDVLMDAVSDSPVDADAAPQAKKPKKATYSWSGNIDLAKLHKVVEEKGAENVAYVSFEMPVNLAGGLPVSMENIQEVYKYCRKKNILVIFDATRVAENSYMIQQYDPYYAKATIKSIVQETMQYCDGATISGKKDFIANMGGVVLIRDRANLADRCRSVAEVSVGSPFNGGLPAADLAAMAQGIREMVDQNYMAHRVEQSFYLAKLIHDLGVPVMQPAGTHGVFLETKRFVPHIPKSEFATLRLMGEFYLEGGVRAIMINARPTAEDPDPYELIRLAIPRRVYSECHMTHVAETVRRVYERRLTITQGLRRVPDPTGTGINPHFMRARFEPVETTPKSKL